MLALRVEQKINYAVFILCIAAAFGLFFSRAVLSIATVGLSLAGIVHLISAPKKWLSNSLLLVLLAFVGWLALSFFYTPSALIKNYFQEVSFKFSVFGIFAGVFTAQLSQRQKAVILLCFSGFASLVALGTLYNYLTHYQEINELISKSKPIPVITGYFHISFSLMLGFSVLAMLWLLLFNRDSLGQFRWFMILSGSINFILIHVI
ncbi:hypothetical protein GC194_05580, partial [bacterium]|nr:hypothetical protein [bacterium]